MALEISTAGIELRYAASTTGTTRPTTGYTKVPNIKSTPDLNPEPSTLDVTDLSDLVYKRYIKGLRDMGGSVSFTANLTSAFKTAWETLVSAYATAIAANKTIWYEIYIPTIGSFFIAGEPCELGLNAYDVDSVAEINVYVTPNIVHGWDTSTTLASN